MQKTTWKGIIRLKKLWENREWEHGNKTMNEVLVHQDSNLSTIMTYILSTWIIRWLLGNGFSLYILTKIY